MTLENRIQAFSRLGIEIEALLPDQLNGLDRRAGFENPWFTPENIAMALSGISQFLSDKSLRQWTSNLPQQPKSVKSIGVSMAGNIPLAGFHDALSVLISGQRLRAKLSSQDTVLMKAVLGMLTAIEPAFEDYIFLEERLNNADAMIATGGNNTARYFEYYFRNIPHIIRKNRSSVAILTGKETAIELDALSIDVFSYFGLGCRNISKLFVPFGYDFNAIMQCWEKYTPVVHHHKYANNYDYQRGIMLINQIHFYDNGVVLLKEETAMVSPISVVYYEYYSSPEELNQKIKSHEEQIQCIVSAGAWFNNSFDFGKAQYPSVDDYADGINTLIFLEGVVTGSAILPASL